MVTVQYANHWINNMSMEDLKNIPLRGVRPAGYGPMQDARRGQLLSRPAVGAATHKSGYVPLGSVADIQQINTPTEVDHNQIRRVIDIYVATQDRSLQSVGKQIDKLLADTKHDRNTVIDVRGAVVSMNQAFHDFGIGLIIAVLLVYLILMAQFTSFIDPFIILMAIPPGLAGVVLILLLTGSTLNIMSLMGVIMMTGIVVSNSILIVEFSNMLHGQGLPLLEATVQACKVRLRPILMTSLATLLGMIPMALGLEAGSEQYAPLARAIIGGLGVSVVVTMFLVPAVYLIIHGRRERNTRRRGGKSMNVPCFLRPLPAAIAVLLLSCSNAALLGQKTNLPDAPSPRLLAQADQPLASPGQQQPAPPTQAAPRSNVQQPPAPAGPQAHAGRCRATWPSSTIPSISIAHLLQLAQAQVTREARSAEFPTAVADLTAVGSHTNSRITAGALNNPTIYDRAAGGLTVGQLITDFGRTHNLVKSAQSNARAQLKPSEPQSEDITLAVDQAFYQALTAQSVLKVAQQTVATRQATGEQIGALTQSKLRSTLDLSLANVQISQAQLLVLDAQNALAAAMANLNAILGSEADTQYDLVDETPANPQAAPANSEDLVQLAFRARARSGRTPGSYACGEAIQLPPNTI